MIDKLNNFSMKSFKNYSGPDKKFNKKNIIFGYNGKGKSSMSKGIIIEYAKENSKEKARIFDDDYVNENLILNESDGKIKGVKANFGEKEVNIENEIKRLQNLIVDTETNEKEIEKLEENIKIYIDDIHEKRKGTARISRKSTSYTIEKILESYHKDLEQAKSIIQTDQELANIKGDDVLEKRLDELRRLDIGVINEFPQQDVWNEIVELCSTSFKSIEIPKQEIMSWLNEGLHIHIDKDETNCIFCNNSIELDNIKKRIDEYNSSELQKASNTIYLYKESLNNYISEINNFLVKKENTLTILNEIELKECYIEIKNSKNSLLKIIDFLEMKLENMEKLKAINNEINNLTDSLDLIINNFNKIKEIINNKQDKIRHLLDNQDILVKGSIALEIKENAIIKNNFKNIEEEQKKLKETLKSNEQLKIKIQELEESKSDVGDFAELLTKTFLDLGIDIDILVDESKKSYILQHSHSEEALTVQDISEGERNLLSLLFFYYELFEDDEQIKFKDNIDILVIDDPISSLDETNRYYVLEIIKSLLEQDFTQTFILTHAWNDFTDLCYGKEKQENYSFFEVYKDSAGESKLRNKKPNDDPYKMLFQEVYIFSQKNKDEELKHCEVYHLPNSMRRIFEYFLSFKSSNNIIPTSSSKSQIENIMDITSNTKKRKLATLLSITNVLSHKVSYNPDEILESAKFLMQQIKNVDSKHFYAMRGTN